MALVGWQEVLHPVFHHPVFVVSFGSHDSVPFFTPSPQTGEGFALQEAFTPPFDHVHDQFHFPEIALAVPIEQRFTGVTERFFPLSLPQTPLIGVGGTHAVHELLHIPGFPLFVPSSHDSEPSLIPFPQIGAGGFGTTAVQEVLHFPG